MLADPHAAQFVVVTRPLRCRAPRRARLARSLSRSGIHVPVVVVNAVGRGTCAACRRGAAEERREVALLQRALATAKLTAPIVVAPAEMPPPAGPLGLDRWSRRWIRSR
jgi:hypothetical protein